MQNSDEEYNRVKQIYAIIGKKYIGSYVKEKMYSYIGSYVKENTLDVGLKKAYEGKNRYVKNTAYDVTLDWG